MLDTDFCKIAYKDNYILIHSELTHPIKQYGSVSFENRLPTTSGEPNGRIQFQWAIVKGVVSFKEIAYIAFVDNALIVKLKDGEENYLLIRNIPYEEYEKSRDLFRSWGIEVRN